MAKGFSKNNPLDKLSGAKVTPIVAVPDEVPKAAVEPKTEPKKDSEIRKPVQEKKKVGRPKTKDVKGTCKNINVAVPIVLLDKWEEVKIVHGSNLTEYITKLIERDMDSNYEHYKDIADSLKNI